MKINNKTISKSTYPYIIAEMSANHNNELDNALSIISAAKKCGADAIKLQTYTPDTITLRCDNPEFQIKNGLWDGYTLYELYEEAHLPWEWHKPLFEHARQVGIDIFSSPFDKSAVDFLENLSAPAYKIASFECIDLPLIRYAASTKKPLIISTGMASKDEVGEAVQAARDGGATDIVLLHCVSGYPAPSENYNLMTIKDLQQSFGCLVGLSDHTIGDTVALCSVALGAVMIEKHFTLDRNGGGPDDSFSMEPCDLEKLSTNTKTAFDALGAVDYGLKHSESGNVQFRRSLYFVRDLPSGAVVSENDIKSVRPGYGISPKYYDELVGARVLVDVQKNTPVQHGMFQLDSKVR